MRRSLPTIPITLALCLLFLVLLAFARPLQQFSFVALYILLGLIGVVFFIGRRWQERLDFVLLGVITASFLIVWLLSPPLDQTTLTLRAAGITSLLLLTLVLLIGPWSYLSERVMRLYHFRRHLGVAVLFLGLLHAALIFSFQFGYSVIGVLSSLFTFYGAAALSILLWLGITSWDTVQLRVPKHAWYVLHTALLFVFLALARYVYTIARPVGSELVVHATIVGLFTLAWIFVAPYSLVGTFLKSRIMGWKQLHVLIWIAYASLVLHVAMGPMQFGPLWIRILFWSSVIFVLCSHLAGWIVRLREDWASRSKIAAIHEARERNGVRYVGVAHTAEFANKQAIKVMVSGQAVGVFKVADGYRALSNFCRHQKGPLHKGRVFDCTVECPWHAYTFSLDDGSYLGKQDLRVPVYDVFVEGEILFVSEKPQP